MICPNCGIKLKCVESRARGVDGTYRRYACPKCDRRFTSMEHLAGAIEEPGAKAKKIELTQEEIHRRLHRPGRY
jgi:transcriptional regulator NrdR family protein